ncbi:MAG: undecaprenyl-diphosphate phosphatase [Clostridia bacterium]|nr:undecaprenyl-diphosphate phosphatase [Clostridia bacterium]
MTFDLIELIKTVIIGIIEGVTEWLPVSSTGHMLLFDAFIPLNMTEEFKRMFFVVIQLGAILAVVAMFWSRMFPFAISKRKLSVDKNIISIWVRVAAACVPSAVLGFLFDDWLEANFGSPVTIAVMLIVYGIAFIIIERRNRNVPPKVFTLAGIDLKTSLFIGLFQVLSMIPGTSRSGATITGALLLGVSRTAAAEFTFFLAVPTMLGASLLKILKFGFAFSQAEFLTLIIGMAVAFAVSMLSIKFLMDYVRRRDFTAFGIYRIILGFAVVAVFYMFK